LIPDVLTGKKFIDHNDDFDDTSLESHGTFISGIIAAGECKNNRMKSLASDVSIISTKITCDERISNADALLEASLKIIINKTC